MNEARPQSNNNSEQENGVKKELTSNDKSKKQESIEVSSESSQITEAKNISGPVSEFLSSKGLPHNSLEQDHIGIETIKIEAKSLIEVVSSLKESGFDYLQCQGGYDEGPGKNLVCFYHFTSINETLKNYNNKQENIKTREVRIKVFLEREGDLTVPSLYKLFKGADWQERETFDMFGIHFEGHPHPKRLLMPEDWKGWPLRKDYVQPDFYEMQDAF